jgi:uncharacterized alpha-E superfamily protein
MLSRVADRIYWMSRYLERVENTARLLATYSELLMDLPAEAQLDWSVPLRILGLEQAWFEAGKPGNELDFLLCGGGNSASLLAALNEARENARTTRDVLPSEAWLAINQLHLFAEEVLPNAARQPGMRLSLEFVRRCNEITGIVESAVSRGPVYQFIRMGRCLERADMTSRMIEVAATIMLTGREELQHYTTTIWRGVLRALTAYQMYRQHVRRRIVGEDVLTFLLLDPLFPRSVAYCVRQLDQAATKLPRSEKARYELARLQHTLAELDLEDITFQSVTKLADDLQIELATLNGAIFNTWLNPARIV